MTPQRAFGPTVAGQFYPAASAPLEDKVRSYLAEGSRAGDKIPADRRVVGVIAPHAGYVYSGKVAGWAYSALKTAKVKTAVVLGPNHHRHTSQPCTLEADVYRTPVGDVPLDSDLTQRLLRRGAGQLGICPDVFAPEHSLDVQMPFIKVALPDARVVPIIVPYMDRQLFRNLARLISDAVGDDSETALIVSSDLSHFFPYDVAQDLDDEILRWVESNDTASLLAQHDQRRGPCGVAAIVVALDTLHSHFRDGQVIRLQYQNSGDSSGDRRRVVGYGAMALTAPKS